MTLSTPMKIRTLQRKLYTKAKQEPGPVLPEDRRMPWCEEHRKAVYGKTVCTV